MAEVSSHSEAGRKPAVWLLWRPVTGHQSLLKVTMDMCRWARGAPLCPQDLADEEPLNSLDFHSRNLMDILLTAC